MGRWVTWGREGHTAISKEDRSVQREALCRHLGLVVVVRLDRWAEGCVEWRRPV